LATTATVDVLLDRLKAGLAGEDHPKLTSNNVDNKHRISTEAMCRYIRTIVRRHMLKESEVKT
jgi:hypothetical protein